MMQLVVGAGLRWAYGYYYSTVEDRLDADGLNLCGTGLGGF